MRRYTWFRTRYWVFFCFFTRNLLWVESRFPSLHYSPRCVPGDAATLICKEIPWKIERYWITKGNLKFWEATASMTSAYYSSRVWTQYLGNPKQSSNHSATQNPARATMKPELGVWQSMWWKLRHSNQNYKLKMASLLSPLILCLSASLTGISLVAHICARL